MIKKGITTQKLYNLFGTFYGLPNEKLYCILENSYFQNCTLFHIIKGHNVTQPFRRVLFIYSIKIMEVDN